MNNYDFSFDTDTYEIFPREVASKPNVVFHGTCAYHANKIESLGFIVNSSPYDLDTGELLCDLLESSDFNSYDSQKGILKWTTAFGMRHYIDAIQKKQFRLSFAALSSACIPFTQGEIKGGQAMKDIRSAKQIIETAISSNPKLEEKVPNNIWSVFKEIDAIDQSNAIVYAIELPQNLEGVTVENLVTYSTIDITPNSLIGKVSLPDILTTIDPKIVTAKTIHKITNGIGRLLNNLE